MSDELTYYFITEDGPKELTYQEYLLNDDLTKKIRNRSRAHLILGRTIVSYDRKWLYHSTNHKPRRDFELLEEDFKANPLKYYMPVCAASGFDSVSHQFINDVSNDICLLLGPNRFTKTTLLFIKMLTVRGLIKCDPTWPVFTEHGVRYTDWTGPKDIGIATFQQKNISRTLWPQVIQKWTPDYELGPYGRTGNRSPDTKIDPKIKMVSSKSLLYMMTYEMKRAVFESQALQHFAWDEFPPFWGFDGVETRMATTRTDHYDDDLRVIDGGGHDIGVTPIVMDDAEYETGAGTWLEDLAEGRETYGLKVQTYRGSLDEVPDWIYPEAVKRQKKEMWIDKPKQRIANGDKSAQRDLERGMSRYYGIFETRGSRVYPEWDQAIHMIPEFEIPSNWTYYRGLDHGRTHPAAILVAAVDENDNVYVVNTKICVDKNVTDIAETAINAVGNYRKRVIVSGIKRDLQHERYTEIMSRRNVRWTKMDSRAFSKKSDEYNETLGEMFRRYGLYVTKASGRMNAMLFPMVAQRLMPDAKRKFPRHHPKAGELGSPRLFVLDTNENRQNFVEKIEKYTKRVTKNGVTDDAKAGDDDMMDALKYLVAGNPVYIPYFGTRTEGANNAVTGKLHSSRNRNSVTAY